MHNQMNNIITNNTLKDYYIQLHQLHENTLKLVNGVTEAFKTYSPDVYVSLDDSNETIRIPSFLYLENKVEEINNIVNNLINLPKNGESWLTESNNLYKINIVNSDIVPETPQISFNTNSFGTEENNFLKDLVFPKTYLRLDLSNVKNNINDVLVKKIILYNDTLIENIFNDESLKTYNDYKEKLYLMKEGLDYKEYDQKLSMPTKEYIYDSKFDILNINSYKYDEDQESSTYNSLIYEIRLNTLEYSSIYDSSISFRLKEGDYLSLYNHYNIFKVIKVNTYTNYDNDNNIEYIVTLQETNGHTVLSTIEDNSEMYFTLYNNVLDNYKKYINVPLEEDDHVILFVSALQQNTKSNWSNGIKVNLNTVMGEYNGRYISYIDYYNNYCKNIGDILTSISQVSYAQLSEFNTLQLQELTSSIQIKDLVTSSLYKNDAPVLSISVINNHLVDDDLTNNLLNLHKQKIEVSTNLNNINQNIDSTYNQLINTDFTEETSLTQDYLKSKLKDYYNERLTNQQQLISLVNNIDLIKNDITGTDSLKYRVRGITNVENDDNLGESNINLYLNNVYGKKCQLIGLEVEYKYKNIRQNSTTIQNNQTNDVFSNWNKYSSIDKQRYLKFTEDGYNIEFVNYDNNVNIIKWNQVDIPITKGEDIIIRIRYKYSIGQPFINLYTPWSDEITIEYDPNLNTTTDISQILEQNNKDLINTNFISELINGGYQEHITNKLVDNSQVFYHMPENIYSGFNTPENNFISLKDKLQDMDNTITEWQKYIEDDANAQYKVYLQYDERMIELHKNTTNSISFQQNINIHNTFVKKNLNIVIKNVGATSINFYSIFAGDTEVPLLHSDIPHYIYDKYLSEYERVPLLLDNINDPKKSVFPQYLGQWIYFRAINPYTKEYLYYNNQDQNYQDTKTFGSSDFVLNYNPLNNSLSQNNNQIMLGYRDRSNNFVNSDFGNYFRILPLNLSDSTSTTTEKHYTNISTKSDTKYNNCFDSDNTSKFVYDNILLKYEHFEYVDPTDNTTKYLNENVNISNDILNNVIKLNGVVLIPQLLSKSQIMCDNNKNTQYKKLNTGESLSIPVLLEYYLTNDNNNVYKTLSFSLQPSLNRNIDNYILKVNVHNNLISEQKTSNLYLLDINQTN